MPEIRYYTVTQEREVTVKANNAVDAFRIADLAFDRGQTLSNAVIDGTGGIVGNTTTKIRTRDIRVMEDY